LSIEEWRFWEIMQDGWEPVTSDTFTIDPNTHPNPPPAGQCYQIRFKNRNVLPPTATPTPTHTPIPTHTPTPRYTPTHTPTPGVCETGRLETTIWGRFHSYRLDEIEIIHPLYPLPWQSPTVFNIVGYAGPVKWTLYQPYWEKQVGGYQYVYPGGNAGDDFTLFVETDCGTIQLQTAVDDPTATPDPNSGHNVWLPVIF
jgi:hypothetical protein